MNLNPKSLHKNAKKLALDKLETKILAILGLAVLALIISTSCLLIGTGFLQQTLSGNLSDRIPLWGGGVRVFYGLILQLAASMDLQDYFESETAIAQFYSILVITGISINFCFWVNVFQLSLLPIRFLVFSFALFQNQLESNSFKHVANYSMQTIERAWSLSYRSPWQYFDNSVQIFLVTTFPILLLQLILSNI